MSTKKQTDKVNKPKQEAEMHRFEEEIALLLLKENCAHAKMINEVDRNLAVLENKKAGIMDRNSNVVDKKADIFSGLQMAVSKVEERKPMEINKKEQGLEHQGLVLRRKSTGGKKRYERKFSLLNETIERLQAELDSEKRNLLKLDNENKGLVADLQLKQQEAKDAQKKSHELRSQNDMLLSQIGKLKKEVTELEKLKAPKLLVEAEISKINGELTNQNTLLRRHNVSLREEIGAIKKKFDYLHEIRITGNIQLAEANKNFNKAQSRIEYLESKVWNLRCDLEECETELDIERSEKESLVQVCFKGC